MPYVSSDSFNFCYVVRVIWKNDFKSPPLFLTSITFTHIIKDSFSRCEYIFSSPSLKVFGKCGAQVFKRKGQIFLHPDFGFRPYPHLFTTQPPVPVIPNTPSQVDYGQVPRSFTASVVTGVFEFFVKSMLWPMHSPRIMLRSVFPFAAQLFFTSVAPHQISITHPALL